MSGLLRNRRRWANWSAFIVRPSVALTIPWVGACTIWVRVIKLPSMPWPEDPDAIARVISTTQYGWITAVNALLLGALLFEGRLALASPPDLKRAHLTTVVLALLLLLGLQYGAWLAVQPLSR